MSSLPSADIHCPYCGEGITVVIDNSMGEHQQYTEDCQVCCKPIIINVELDEEGVPQVSAHSEDDA